MNEFLDAALLGLGAGAVYALLAQGLVVVYRGSGVLNFAQGAFAMVGAFLYYQFNSQQGWPVAVSIVAVVVVMGIFGATVQLVIMHPMRTSTALSRVIATLGLLLVLEALAQIKYGTNPLVVNEYLPTGTVRFSNGMYIGEDKLVILIVGVVVTAG